MYNQNNYNSVIYKKYNNIKMEYQIMLEIVFYEF